MFLKKLKKYYIQLILKIYPTIKKRFGHLCIKLRNSLTQVAISKKFFVTFPNFVYLNYKQTKYHEKNNIDHLFNFSFTSDCI